MQVDIDAFAFVSVAIQAKINNITDDSLVIDDSQGVSCFMETDVKHSEIMEGINEIMGLLKELVEKDISEINETVINLNESNNASTVGN